MRLPSPDTRVINLTRNCKLKPHQAKSRIDQGLAEWVEFGISIRELDRSERLAKFAEMREHRRIIPQELPPINGMDIIERMPRSEVFTPTVKYDLLGAAREFCKCPSDPKWTMNSTESVT